MKAVFDLLAHLLASPHLAGFLQINEQDFSHCDRVCLETYGSVPARWLWIVQYDGTCLVRLGVHSVMSAFGLAALDREGPVKVYLVNSTEAVQVSVARARELLQSFDYSATDAEVLYRGEPIATITFDRDSSQSVNPRVTVRMSSLRPLSHEQRVCLFLFAIHEVSQRVPNFLSIRPVELDKVPLMQWIQATADQAAPCHEQSAPGASQVTMR